MMREYSVSEGPHQAGRSMHMCIRDTEPSVVDEAKMTHSACGLNTVQVGHQSFNSPLLAIPANEDTYTAPMGKCESKETVNGYVSASPPIGETSVPDFVPGSLHKSLTVDESIQWIASTGKTLQEISVMLHNTLPEGSPEIESLDYLMIMQESQQILQMQDQLTLLSNKKRRKVERDIRRLRSDLGYQKEGAFMHSVKSSLETAVDITSSIDELMERVQKTVSRATDPRFVDDVLKRIEQFLLTLMTLGQQKTYLGTLGVIATYVSTLCDRSFTKIIMQEIKQFFKEPEYRQESGWLTKNWKTVVEGPFGSAIGKIMSLMIAVGFLPSKATTNMGRGIFELFKVKRFSDDGSSMPSFIECICSTVDWVIDIAWPASVSGNFQLLLRGEKMQDLDEQYRKVADCVDLYLAASYTLLKKKHDIGDSGFEVVQLIDACIETHTEAKKDPETTHSQKAEMEKRLLNLNKFSNAIQAVFKTSTIRVRPYTFLLRGGSGVNKTGLNDILIHTICKANGLPEGDQYHCQFNEGDQYMSDFHPKQISISFDDLCNTKPEREQINPLFKIIQFVNNVHCTALSAEAHLKGKKDINVKIVSATTNSTSLNAEYFSCNPSSIMSRFNLVVDVRLKPEAVNEKGRIKDEYVGVLNPDMWDLTANWVKVTRLSKIKDVWNLVPHEGVVDLATIIDFVEEDSKMWFAKQQKLVDAATSIHTAPHCVRHPMFTMPCLKCGSEHFAYIKEAGTGDEDVFEDAIDLETIADQAEEDVLQSEGLFKSPLVTDTMIHIAPDDREKLFACDMFIQDSLALMCHEPKSLSQTITDKLNELKLQVEKVDPMYKAMALAGSVLSMCLVASAFYKKLEEQASIETVEAIAMPPNVVAKRDNMYKKTVKLKTSYPEASHTATQQQFIDKVDVSLMLVKVFVVLDQDGNTATEHQCVASIPVGGGWWLMPYHAFEVESPVGQVRLDFSIMSGTTHKRFSERVCIDDVMRIASSDCACVRIVRGGCNYDFSKFFSERETKLPVGTSIQILPKSNSMVEEGILPSKGVIMGKITGYRIVTVESSQYYAVEYTTDAPTFRGLCGAPVVTTGPNPMILGIHTAGKSGRQQGAAAIVIQSDLKLEYQGIWLSEKAPMPTSQLGTSFNNSTNCKWKSPIHWIPEDKEVSLEYHGQHDLATTTFKTKVAPSILAEKLEEIGIVREHAGPLKSSETMARQEHLVNCAECTNPCDPMILKEAITDLKMKLEGAISPEFSKYVHALKYSDALNGVPGVAGFDPIPPNTAPGFGRTGPKWKLCIQDAIDQKMDGGCPRLLSQYQNDDGTWSEVCEYVFDDEKLNVREEVEKLFTDFSEHIRPNIIFKCNLKDEALPIAKVHQGKMRVFAGAPMTFVIIARMIFSPLCVFMTQTPTLFESAVGVDAQGKDWDFIGNYVMQHGRDRVFGGDFSKYDQRMRCDFTIAAMEVLKSFMRECGYDEDLLEMVDGIACEICFPMYEISGVFVQIDGSNPSGHPLTVILNGMVNCLKMRYCYYAMHHRNGTQDIPLFHTRVALMTYGDDNVAGVSKGETLFNHVSVAKEMALIGMKYTMPDKDSEATAFIPSDSIDFLKRKFRVHEHTGTMIGALDIKSIYKSLTTTMKVKGRDESEAEIMAGNIANALTELWAHGPEVFQEHKKKFECLKEITDGPFRVGQFWREVTEESCLERYNKTTCVYEECIKTLEIPYEYQSEILNYTDLNISPYRGIMMHYLSSCISGAPRHVLDVMFECGAAEIQHRKPSTRVLKYRLCQRQKRERHRRRIVTEINRSAMSLHTKVLSVRAAYSVVHKVESYGGVFKAAKLYWQLAARGCFHKIPVGVGRIIQEFVSPRFVCVSKVRCKDGSIILTYHLC